MTDTKIEQPLAAAVLTTVPYGRLTKSPLNVRANAPLTGIEGLADSIAAAGLNQNLVVHEIKGKRKADLRYGVAAGGRRTAALDLLFSRGLIDENYPVPVKVVLDADARLISLTENLEREPMGPYQEIMAFAALIEDGRSVDFIAAAFHVPAMTVYRRLRLAGVAPELLSLLLTDEITLEQLHSLALTEDQDMQRRVWAAAEGQSYLRNPHNLRKAITASEEQISECRLAKMPGMLDEYAAAGGEIRIDLFNERDDAGYIANMPLLTTLVQTRLQAVVDEYKAAGWMWAEYHAGEVEYQVRESWLYLPCPTPVVSEESTQQIAAMEAQLAVLTERDDAISALLDDEERELTEEEDAELERIDEARSELQENIKRLQQGAPIVYADEDKAVAGVMVSVDQSGQIRIDHGIVRKSDMADAVRLGADLRDRWGDKSATIDRMIAKASAPKPVHSESLIRSLTAHQTAAVQAEMIAQPNVTLVILTHSLLCREFRPSGYHNRRGQASEAVTVSGDGLPHELLKAAGDLADSVAWQARQAAHQAWAAKLPEGFAKTFDWLLAWPQEDVIALLAYLTAVSVNGISGSEGERRLGQMADVLNLDMTRYWQPTAEGYFSRVNKDRVVAVVTENVSAEAAVPLAGMKKGQASAAAQELLAGRGWLPEIFQSAK